MKNLIEHLIITVFLFITLICNSQSPVSIVEVRSELIGTWVSEDDNNWKITFNSRGTCRWDYVDNGTTETDMFYFNISETSPQCGQEVRTDMNNHYIILTDVQDSDKYCYEILGIDDQSLSLLTIGLIVKNFYFLKQ